MLLLPLILMVAITEKMEHLQSASGASAESDTNFGPSDTVNVYESGVEVPEEETAAEDEEASEAIEPSEPTYLLDFAELDLTTVPAYAGEMYVELNGNLPEFTEADKQNPEFEYYSDLDELGRCGVATANLCEALMPTEPRGQIGAVRPTGWHTIKYPDLIEDNYLYNRSHLIAYALTGENANEKNLITGTRYMNHGGMLFFEMQVMAYIEDTGNHVLYRVTPCFYRGELLARGVHMEAYSTEDNGEGICFNVFVYNVQPGIKIDYATGESEMEKP
jgi:DNA-entry nuclease